MPERDGYLPGVPCWVDTTQPDPDAAAAFYRELFGWETENMMPPGSGGKYLVARVHGGDVAAISSPPDRDQGQATWNTYIWVESADETAAKVRAAGGTVTAEPFDVPGADLSHHRADGGAVDCSFETILRRHELSDPVLWQIAQVVHEADLDDERYDAPGAAGLDIVLRGLSMVCDDPTVIALTGPIFDGLYEYHRRALLLGREPA